MGGSNGGTLALTDAVWQSTDGGVTWSPLGSNLTLFSIPTLLGVGVALLDNGVFALYGGVLGNGTAVSSVATTSTLFATAPALYTAPFLPRAYHAYTTIPGTNTTLFCGGLTSNGSAAASSQQTNDCWAATRPELGPSAWTQLTAAAPFPSSLAHAALVTLYDNTSTLLLCGGAVYTVGSGGVYSSTGTAVAACWRSVSVPVGASWTAAISAPWAARTDLLMTSDLQGYAYLYGGYSTTAQQYLYDAWITLDKANTWLPIQLANGQAVQDGCLVLYYTQTLYNGVFGTYPQLTLYGGFTPGGGGGSYVEGSYFAPVSFSSSAPTFIPAIPTFPLSVSIFQSVCQVTINLAGTLTGFGVSGLSPNPLLSGSVIASLAAAILGIPPNAVQVCIHVTYISTTQYGNSHHCDIYIVSTTTVNQTAPLIANITQGNFTRSINATLSSNPSVSIITPTLSSIGSSSSSSSTGGSSVASVSSTAAAPASVSSSTGRSSAGVVGDPQFVGLRGQRFQVHGIDGAVYNLISEADTQVNARFAYLSAGHCPIIDGFPDTNCWSHPGSYISQLSFQQRVNGTVHTALLTAGGAKDGFSLVQVDGRAVQVGQTATIGSFSVYRKTAHAVSVTTAHFAFELSSSDRFINQAVALTVPMSHVRGAHGLLGQTHSTKLHSGSPIPFIEGGVDDYTIADDDMLGSDFPYNRFVVASGEQAAE